MTGPSADPEAPAPPTGSRPTSRSRRRLALLGIAALALLAVLPLRGLLRNQGPPMEEGFMLVFPERFLKGDLPNRDFLHLYGPGSLWALAATFKLLGTRLLVERLFGLAQQMGIVAAVYLLARPWGRTAAVVCGALSLVIIMPPIGLTALAWVGGVALGALGLAAGLSARRTADEVVARKRMLGAGLLFGGALLFRPDLVVAVGLGGGVVFARLSRPLRQRLIAGLAVGVAPYLVHLATAGPGNVIQGMVLDPVVYLRGGRRLSIPPPPGELQGFLQRAAELRKLDWPLPTLSSPAQLTVWFFLLLGAVLALVLTGRAMLRAAPASHRARVMLAVGLFSVGMLPQAVQRTDSTHFAWVSCVPVALLPLALVEWSRRFASGWNPRRRSLVAGAVAFAFLGFVIPRYTVLIYADYTLQTFGIHREAYRIERNGRVFYYGKRQVAQALPGLLADLDRASNPGDTLLVGTADLRQTPYSDAFLYYLFPELPPATYYIEMDPGVANADDSGLADEVRAADFLVLSNVWNDWAEPNDSRELGSNEPNEVVDERFCLIGDYHGQYELYERCDRPGVDRVRVQLYGDSLVYNSAKYWLDMMDGNFEAGQWSYPGTNTCDALSRIRKDLTDKRPDVVAIAYGGNDATPCMRHDDGSKLSRQEFLAKFRSDTEEALRTLGDDVTVYLFAPPAMPDGSEADLHDIYRDLADDHPDVHYRDGGRLVSPDRTWVETLPCLAREKDSGDCTGPVVDGVETNVVRAWDRVHFCPEKTDWGEPCPVYSSGAYRFALTIYEDLRDGEA